MIGPNADRPEALLGCYSFANHVLPSSGGPLGFEIPTVLEALPGAFERPASCRSSSRTGLRRRGRRRLGHRRRGGCRSVAQLAFVVVGDHAGLFGRGTVGEGNDSDNLELPGVQRELVEAVVATGTPVVMVLLTGRPYVIGWALDGGETAPAAVVQAFFPGEGGGLAIA